MSANFSKACFVDASTCLAFQSLTTSIICALCAEGLLIFTTMVQICSATGSLTHAWSWETSSTCLAMYSTYDCLGDSLTNGIRCHYLYCCHNTTGLSCVGGNCPRTLGYWLWTTTTSLNIVHVVCIMGAEGGGGVGDFYSLIKLVIGMCCAQEVALFQTSLLNRFCFPKHHWQYKHINA